MSVLTGTLRSLLAQLSLSWMMMSKLALYGREIRRLWTRMVKAPQVLELLGLMMSTSDSWRRFANMARTGRKFVSMSALATEPRSVLTLKSGDWT